MDSQAELGRIQQFTTASRHRIRRLDVLLEEQLRILQLDPTLSAKSTLRHKRHRFKNAGLTGFWRVHGSRVPGGFFSRFLDCPHLKTVGF